VKVTNGCIAGLPLLPEMALPKQVPRWTLGSGRGTSEANTTIEQGMAGRFTQSFSYSGPTTGVRLQRDMRDGKRPYVDREFTFAGLPGELIGADWVQAANRDNQYSAVDLMELALKSGSMAWIAHDDRLPRPAWLLRQFQPTRQTLQVEGRPMQLFQRRVARDESLTLGPNADDSSAPAANMYLVFVNAIQPDH
jgi:beta-galactosidase